jgi:hypothetical protein
MQLVGVWHRGLHSSGSRSRPPPAIGFFRNYHPALQVDKENLSCARLAEQFPEIACDYSSAKARATLISTYSDSFYTSLD